MLRPGPWLKDAHRGLSRSEGRIAVPSCQEAGGGIWAANTWVRSGVVMGSASTILPSARR